MACFAAPAAEAVITTIIEKYVRAKEDTSSETKLRFSEKLSWLNRMLWGGSFLLMFEHIWHGEISPWFPFLTAANSPEEFSEMIGEISSTGVLMALLITAVWCGMVLVSNAFEKDMNKDAENASAE